MSKKDFELIAGVIKNLDFNHLIDVDERRRLRRKIALEFASALQRTNPAFNNARFNAACTKEP